MLLGILSAIETVLFAILAYKFYLITDKLAAANALFGNLMTSKRELLAEIQALNLHITRLEQELQECNGEKHGTQ